MKYFDRILILVGGIFAFSKHALAHEAYVIPSEIFWDELAEPFSAPDFGALNAGTNLGITLLIVGGVLLALLANYYFRRSQLGKRVHAFFERYAHLGPQFLRFAIALALFFSALTNTFLGPELPLEIFSFSILARIILFAASFMIAFGFVTEIAALLVLLLFLVSFVVVGPYMVSYSNYFGELLVLALFGMRVFSIDKYIFGKLKHLQNLEKYETLIVRGFYGLSLIFAAITVKLLHPDLTLYVVNHYHLTQFHWLFPSDPALVVLGAGIVEIIIGLFIILGFELRLTVLISLFYITLSLIFFGEQVWPHLILYGISLSLLVQPEQFTIDNLLFDSHEQKHSWWRCIFHAHTEVGKSLQKGEEL